MQISVSKEMVLPKVAIVQLHIYFINFLIFSEMLQIYNKFSKKKAIYIFNIFFYGLSVDEIYHQLLIRYHPNVQLADISDEG